MVFHSKTFVTAQLFIAGLGVTDKTQYGMSYSLLLCFPSNLSLVRSQYLVLVKDNSSLANTQSKQRQSA